MASRRTHTEVESPQPPYKTIAEQIAALLLVGKEVGAEQETMKVALQAFARASEAGKSHPTPEPF